MYDENVEIILKKSLRLNKMVQMIDFMNFNFYYFVIETKKKNTRVTLSHFR